MAKGLKRPGRRSRKSRVRFCAEIPGEECSEAFLPLKGCKRRRTGSANSRILQPLSGEKGQNNHCLVFRNRTSYPALMIWSNAIGPCPRPRLERSQCIGGKQRKFLRRQGDLSVPHCNKAACAIKPELLGYEIPGQAGDSRPKPAQPGHGYGLQDWTWPDRWDARAVP